MTILLAHIWQTVGAMAPYLLFGFLVAGILSVSLSPEFVEHHLGKGKISTIVKASLLGIPLPLCSCGVIPVAAGLRRHGASRGATTAFLMSTPQTGIDSLLVTYSLLGPLFAIYRPMVALVSGVFGGVLVTYGVGEEEKAEDQEKRCTDSCCTDVKGSWYRRAFRYGFYTLPRDIGASLFLGLLLAGLIGYLVPENFFANYLTSPLISMVIMLLCGIPLYVCATASVPVAAALLAKGVTPGAVLVFLMTGPATNAAAITTIWKTMGRKTAILFLVAVVLSAFGAGFLLDLIVTATPLGVTPPAHEMSTPILKTISAITLLLVLLYSSLVAPPHAEESPKVQDGLTLAVEGMTCSHCEAHVVATLKALPNVETASAHSDSGRAVVKGKNLLVDELISALDGAGHNASLISED